MKEMEDNHLLSTISFFSGAVNSMKDMTRDLLGGSPAPLPIRHQRKEWIPHIVWKGTDNVKRDVTHTVRMRNSRIYLKPPTKGSKAVTTTGLRVAAFLSEVQATRTVILIQLRKRVGRRFDLG